MSTHFEVQRSSSYTHEPSDWYTVQICKTAEDANAAVEKWTSPMYRARAIVVEQPAERAE